VKSQVKNEYFLESEMVFTERTGPRLDNWLHDPESG